MEFLQTEKTEILVSCKNCVHVTGCAFSIPKFSDSGFVDNFEM